VDLMATVEVLLRQSPDEALCTACLAFACEVSLIEMRDVFGRLVAADGRTIEIASVCASCRRAVPSAIYRQPARKCAHCSQLIQNADVSRLIGGDLFHAVCWRLLITDETIRVSRALSRRFRELIEQSRSLKRPGTQET
jgi:hypothetical protein